MNHKNKIAIVGLGYVGLPLARLFATKYPVVGFDINAARVQELQSGKDATLEVEDHLLQSVLLDKNPSDETIGLFCSDQIEDIADANIFIITVPTPVDKNNRPVLTPLYKSVITAGTHLAPTIKVAEAAKVIENSQRDINIAFVNELAKIFNLMNIDTHEVLKAAGTKWNFLPFKPGLVGGHCIGVDPYYLAQKAQEFGYHPEIILAGRRLNDSMGQYVAEQVIKTMIKKDINVNGAEILMLGITFKENCPDVRNTKIVDVIRALEDFGVKVTTFDPWANPEEVDHEYKLECQNTIPNKKFDAIVLGVAHKEFLDMDFSFLRKENAILYDVKGVLKNSDNKL